MEVCEQPTLWVVYKSVYMVYEDTVYTRLFVMHCFTWWSIIKVVQLVYGGQRILKKPVHPASKHKTL